MIPAARPYVASLAIAAALLLTLRFFWLGGALLVACAALATFFRDPERAVPEGDDLVVSPADGRVVEVPRGSGGSGECVAIFLSLADVHVNRSPVAGKVLAVRYTPGTFRPAWEPAAGASNERNTLTLDGPAGTYEVSQIAGLVARRIHCSKRPGDHVGRGERIGYIAFGSRTELTMPPGAEVAVRIGDRVRGGETVIARLPRRGGES
ncbi:MAG: phosphatidylserine decarboxylase [Acidobacteria bacterium]|nr:phosphatidylserine decarboxylase [Acidobacteriota bacterium]